MARIFDLISQSRIAYLTGTTAEARTVPGGAAVVMWTASAAAGAVATVDILPGGAGQKAIALETITIPAGKSDTDELVLHRLGAGTVFTFGGSVDSYRIAISYLGGS